MRYITIKPLGVLSNVINKEFSVRISQFSKEIHNRNVEIQIAGDAHINYSDPTS